MVLFLKKHWIYPKFKRDGCAELDHSKKAALTNHSLHRMEQSESTIATEALILLGNGE